MARPLIALLTDFGLRDHYVGAMKGVDARHLPGCDACRYFARGVPARRAWRRAGAAAAYRYFPSGTIFLVVVDPGVGSTRRAIAAEVGDYRFVAPDNGVLSVVLDELPPRRAVELTDPQVRARPTISRTFEGRDRFAPAAAWLATGVQLTALGRPASSLVRLDVPQPRAADAGVEGEVLRVDRFGNLTTNIDAATLGKMSGSVTVRIGTHVIPRIRCDLRRREAGRTVCARRQLGSAGDCGQRRQRRSDAWSGTRRCGAASPERVIRFRAHMIGFDLTDEQQLLEQSVREWAAREIAPHIKEDDRHHRFDRDRVLGGMAQLGLLGISVPQQYGGAGMDYVCLGIASEELEYVDTSLRVIMSVHAGLNCLTLLVVGHRGSKAAVPRSAGAGTEDRRVRAHGARRRKRRARDSDDSGRRTATATC